MCLSWPFSDIYSYQSDADTHHHGDEPPGYSSASDHHGSMEHIPMRVVHNGHNGTENSNNSGGNPRPEKTIRKGPFVYREWV